MKSPSIAIIHSSSFADQPVLQQSLQTKHLRRFIPRSQFLWKELLGDKENSENSTWLLCHKEMRRISVKGSTNLTRIPPLRKKLARLLFDFGVKSKLLSTQRTMIVNNRSRPSYSVDNSWQHLRCDDDRALFTTAVVWRQVEQKAVLIF